MPKNNFLQNLKELAHKNGSLLIFDEIRSGFRVNLGGAQKEFSVTPDLSVFGKALANGYPISAVVGRAEVMDMLVSKVFLSSTFYPNSLEQVAALKTLEILERDKILDAIKEKGLRFALKVEKIITNSQIDCHFSGGPWMPFITFNQDDKKLYKKLRPAFYTHLIRSGVFLQPYHHGYIAYRHSDKDLDYTIEMIEEGLHNIKKLI